MTHTKYFVEIGSCDFDTLNELADKGWKGAIVEPISEYLDALPRKLNVTYINSAVDVNKGRRIMNVFNKDIVNRDHDFAGMSSFKEYTAKANASHVTEREVSTITFEDVCKIAGIPRIDLLKIDTEGHDFVILQCIDYYSDLRPSIIKVEHKHMENPYGMESYLQEKGYKTWVEMNDVYAIDSNTTL